MQTRTVSEGKRLVRKRCRTPWLALRAWTKVGEPGMRDARADGGRGLCHIVVVLLVVGAARADAADAPRPSEASIRVVETEAAAKAVIEQARQTGAGLVADLSLGQEGQLVRAKSAESVPPGRYRLHALVARSPHDHILAEAVALRLAAGAAMNVFDAPRWFPAAGELAPVHVDVVVDKPGPLAIAADWIVGDTKLDRMTYRDVAEARRVYLSQRQNAINQVRLRSDTNLSLGGQATDDDLGDEVDDLLADDALRLAPRALTGAELPAHRLLLAGLVLERISPVAVVAVRTDAAAYDPGATGHVTVDLHNRCATPVTAKLLWTVEGDSRPGETVARHEETVTLSAGEERGLALADSLATVGIARLGRVRVEAVVGSLRSDVARTPFVILPPKPTRVPERPKKVFAHYMGCFPTGAFTHGVQVTAGEKMHHDRGDDVSRHGGQWRNYPLVPQQPKLTPEESADLEIRRAMRIGIDGFAVDAWAGDEAAKQVCDTLIKVAAAKNYPFEITICLDPACGGQLVKTVRQALDRWGDNPKFARRDGKPLIFTYSSNGFGLGAIHDELDERIPDQDRDAAVNRLRATELGWHLIGQRFREAEEQIGRPIAYTFDLVYFFHDVPKDLVTPDMPARAAAAIARHVPALNSFGFYGFAGKHAEVAKAVREAGAEWGWAGGMYQKESFLEVFTPKATDWLRFVWADTIDDEATLVQLVTWNDYNENTHIAPAYNTRYTIYDLTSYFIERWRTGKPPAVDRDRVYLTYAKYPNDAKSWPFRIRDRRDRALEVLTILPAPATVRLPGRDIEYEAPAGMHVRQFPVIPGSVIAEVMRDGKVAVRLESPEPITDRPFRQDVGLVCWSTEEERHWKADFGDRPMLTYSEYGDADADGLPNWFEMYWFTKDRGFKPVVSDDPDELLDGPKQHPITRWLDLSTQTLVDPQADPDADRRSNLDEYLKGTDPTVPEQAAAPEPRL